MNKKMIFPDDIFILLIFSILLIYGALRYISTDTKIYQCYAVAFWQGSSGLKKLPSHQCDYFLKVKKATPPFHILPIEYPFLSLIPFTLGLTGPNYETAYAYCMVFIVILLYIALAHHASRKVAIIAVVFLTLGNFGTLGARFDIVPSFLTLVAILFADKKKWNWAFTFLALGVCIKLYPIILLPFFLIAHQFSLKNTKSYTLRCTPALIFIAIITTITTISLSVSIKGTISPFTYLNDRPFQIESLGGSLLYLLQPSSSPLYVASGYGSINLQSSQSNMISTLTTVLMILGFSYTLWLYYKKKLSFSLACLAALLITVLFGKVFSPQYLIWLSPLVAYACRDSLKLLILWLIICALTSYIHPYFYAKELSEIINTTNSSKFYTIVTLRNALMIVFMIQLIITQYHRKISKA